MLDDDDDDDDFAETDTMSATPYNTGAEIDKIFDHFDTADTGMLVDRESITQVANVFFGRGSLCFVSVLRFALFLLTRTLTKCDVFFHPILHLRPLVLHESTTTNNNTTGNLLDRVCPNTRCR